MWRITLLALMSSIGCDCPASPTWDGPRLIVTTRTPRATFDTTVRDCNGWTGGVEVEIRGGRFVRFEGLHEHCSLGLAGRWAPRAPEAIEHLYRGAIHVGVCTFYAHRHDWRME